MPKPEIQRKYCENCARIYFYIKHHPGSTCDDVRQALGFRDGYVDNIIIGMDRLGYLLSEDEKGKLYVFDVK